MLLIVKNGVELAVEYGAANTKIRPANSDTNSRPSGKNFIAVGKLNPVANTSFWNESEFATVTVTAPDTVELPAASRARAVSECGPLPAVRVSHASEYGAVVSSTPAAAPSTENCTPTTPTSSVASAVTLTTSE